MQAWAARCSGSTLLEFLLRSAPAPGPLPRAALGEIRRVLARRSVHWGLPRRRNLLILACERGLDPVVLDCLLQAFYRQRRLALFNGTRKLLEADREAVVWAAANPFGPTFTLLPRLFLIDNVDFHERGSRPMHLPVLLAAVRSKDEQWAEQVLLHRRVAPAVMSVAIPSDRMLDQSGKRSGRRRQRKLDRQRHELGFLVECVREAIKTRMNELLLRMDTLNPSVVRPIAAYCISTPISSAHRIAGGDTNDVATDLVAKFHRDLLWDQVGPLVLARMESARRRKQYPWYAVWRWHLQLVGANADKSLLGILPDGLFHIIVSFLSVVSEADAVIDIIAQCDSEDR